MASTSSEPALKAEGGGGGCSDGGGTSESVAMIGNDQLFLYRGLKKAKKERCCTAKERISKMPPCAAGKRSSIYRGVTRHRWTGRYEAHLWDKSTWNQNQNKKGKQVYLGAYDDEEAAARAYDLAALKYWGPGTLINFPVTDYSRDVEEMQNVSREDYLASLRRKSSGFSRGISKYRPLSSRWDSQFGRIPGADYFNSTHYGDDASAESGYTSGFHNDRKIDLTAYIKWWGQNKSRQTTDSQTRSSEERKPGCSQDIASSDLEALDWAVQPTEPYQMPHLGLFISHEEERKNKQQMGSKKSSAMAILSQSAAYKSLQEKASKKKEISHENEEKEIKNGIEKRDYGKGVEKNSSSYDGGSERNVYPLAPFLSAPLLTNYNAIDPLADPVLWTSLVSVLPAGSSRVAEVTKTESSSDYTFFGHED